MSPALAEPDDVVWTQALCRPIVDARAGLGAIDAARCEKCGDYGIGLSMHHRKKRGQGGSWAPSNIVVVCGDGTRGCHGWIEQNPTAANAEGWHLTTGDPDGSVVPIRHWQIKWCRVKLDDLGNLHPISW